MQSVKKYARNAFTDREQNLIADGIGPARHFIGSDGFVPLAAEQYHFIPDRRIGDVRYITHDLIHANGTDLRRALPVNQYACPVGQAALISIAISNGKRCYERPPGRGEGSSITCLLYTSPSPRDRG